MSEEWRRKVNEWEVFFLRVDYFKYKHEWITLELWVHVGKGWGSKKGNKAR